VFVGLYGLWNQGVVEKESIAAVAWPLKALQWSTWKKTGNNPFPRYYGWTAAHWRTAPGERIVGLACNLMALRKQWLIYKPKQKQTGIRNHQKEVWDLRHKFVFLYGYRTDLFRGYL
jgi:hypothetical protein